MSVKSIRIIQSHCSTRTSVSIMQVMGLCMTSLSEGSMNDVTQWRVDE